MNKKTKFYKKIVAVVICVAILASNSNINIGSQGISLSKNSLAAAEEIDANTPENIQGGTILQTFCWSFNTIKANIASIAAAGYTAVQTSPIQACLDTNPTMELGGNGHWYYHYQPTDFTIGNYQLGTEEEFIAMCDEADAYGVKIIVDVVPNHTTPTQAEISQNLIDAAGGIDKLFHAETGLTNSSNYSNVLESTRYAIGNLPDIDTENAAYQNYFISFLNQCIADGADGFRYDSAKHIGLPNDARPEGVVNNFWERVTTEITNADSIFNYGEVLQGTNDRQAEYVDAIGATTASAYGANIRTALNQGKYLVSNISDYMVDASVNPDNLVTWVESHDNYYNDGTGSVFDNTDVILGWAIITARANGTPLFFSRPEGSSLSNPYGTNTIGIAGDDNYKNDQVVAVNKFRNAMVGQPENLVNPEGNAQVLMIERGTKGVVIVNGSSSAYVLDTTTSLEDGTYINRTEDDSVFTVINGKISGVLPARASVVLYEAEATNSTTIHFYNADKWDSVNTDFSGAVVTNDLDGWWTITVPADVANGFNISLQDGEANHTDELTVNDASALYYANKTAYASKADAEAALGIVRTTVKFFNSGSWDDVSAYAYIDGTEDKLFGTWPGKAAKSEGDGWWSIDIPNAPSENLHVIFNNHGNGKESKNFVISDSASVYVTNENANKYTSKTEALTDIEMLPGSTVVYFYNNKGWSEVSAYTWGTVNFGSWPGKAATNVGDGWWKIALPADPSMDLNLIFNNNGKGAQTANLLVSDITNRYFSAFNNKSYASKEALLAANAVNNNETKVYFYNYKGWDNVYAYATKAGDLLGAFPGKLSTEGQNNWWSITIPAAASQDLQVTFNDGTLENQSDTFVLSDKTKVYLTGANATAFASKSEAETAINVEPTKTTVYFYNSGSWPTVTAYLYGDSTAFGGWPGAACTSLGNGWWKTDIPAEASSNLHVIFNNGGNGAQSSDFIITNTTNTYVTNFNNKKYTSFEEAITDNTSKLVSVTAPTAITGVANGTAVAALGLPATIAITTDKGNKTANVVWNIAEVAYNPSNAGEQTFTVNGEITLPVDVLNSNNISLEVQISVSVKAAVVIPGPDPVVVTPTPTIPPKNELEVTVGNNGTLPVESILKEISNSSNTEVKVSIPFKENTNTAIKLTTDLLAAAKEADKNISVTIKDKDGKDAYTWSFDKKALGSLNKNIAEIDLTLKVKNISSDEALSNALKDTGVVLSFAYDGVLPAQASVKAYVGNVDGVSAGSKIYLYHHNKVTGKLEELPHSTDYIVDENGYITVNILHCSDYVALSKEAPAETVTNILDQVKITPAKQTLYVGGTTQTSTNVKLELPATLELVSRLTDKTSQSAIGAVTVSYSTSNKKVATVLNGKIKAIGEGKATITTKLTLYNGTTKTISTVVTVKKAYIKLVKSTTSLKVGGKFTFTVTVYGFKASDILWTTSKKSVVVINKKTGVATAISKGTDYVNAKAGNKVVEIKVVVK